MTYHLRICAPEDILTSEGVMVENNVSVPLEDMLASPSFEWYPGLCVFAESLGKNIYTGIFSEDACVDVSFGGKFAEKLNISTNYQNFIDYWKYENDAARLVFAIRFLIEKSTLNKLVLSVVDDVKTYIHEGDMLILDNVKMMDQYEFNDAIRQITRKRNDIYRPETTTYRAYTILINGAQCLYGQIDRLPVLMSTHTSLGWNRSMTILRDAVPFRELAVKIVK